MSDLFVLVHSPLVGPLTWALVAEVLRQRGIDALVPVLRDAEDSDQPYWQQEVASVTQALAAEPVDRALVLVGHSGAGALLPAIGQSAEHRITAYIFVDAGLPLDGMSRLEEMAASAPELAEQLRAHLAAGGRFPTWGEEDLRDVVPDARLRRRLLAELQPRPLAFFAEPIPGFAQGPDVPCPYLQFGTTYAAAGERAQRDGWPYRQLAGGHFHMLVDPAGVAAALVDLAQPQPKT
jgi:pimeloyl-ACP methyl ester carboxylesterase